MPYERVDNAEGWSPDAEPRLADWLRQRWTLPTTIGEFLPILQQRNDARSFTEVQIALDGFMMLPAARFMPTELREALAARGFALPDPA